MSAQVSAGQQLSGLDLALPPPPTPFGAYVEAVKIGNLLFLSGMLPVVGHKPQYVGRVGGALSAEDGRKAAEVACLNALSAANAHLGGLDKITGVAKLGVHIATEGDFRSIRRFAERDHSRITSWTELPGVTGHYSAHTSPDQLAADIRRFFRPLRPAASKEN